MFLRFMQVIKCDVYVRVYQVQTMFISLLYTTV